MQQIWIFLAVAAGGAIGASLRYAIHLGMGRGQWSAMPVTATFIANMIGCLLAGVFLSLVHRQQMSPVAQQFWTMGLLGALTTFSAYTIQAMTLIQQGRAGMAMLVAFGSLGVGLALAFGGWRVTNFLLQPTG